MQAQLNWRKEFPAAFPLGRLQQSFHPHQPSLRSLGEDGIQELISSGYQPTPDDCSAVIAVGCYGAAIRTPAGFRVTGVPGDWEVESDLVDLPPLERPAAIAGPFLGKRFIKVSCGHQIFYDGSLFGLMLEAPANEPNVNFRVWKGLQLHPYSGAPREPSQRQFNTNVILEPLGPFAVDAGTVLAVVYLVPRTLTINEVPA